MITSSSPQLNWCIGRKSWFSNFKLPVRIGVGDKPNMSKLSKFKSKYGWRTMPDRRRAIPGTKKSLCRRKRTFRRIMSICYKKQRVKVFFKVDDHTLAILWSLCGNTVRHARRHLGNSLVDKQGKRNRKDDLLSRRWVTYSHPITLLLYCHHSSSVCGVKRW